MCADLSVWVKDGPVLQPTAEGDLSGQRLAVKDLFAIKGYVTGYGNPDWKRTHAPAPETANAVERLLSAGAEMVGKTQTDELAYSLNGANVHYGTPVNPAAPDRLPGGSSSGSAVAVASGQADIGLGTDTGGSIRVPASYCGLYGLRPTWGAIDSTGVEILAKRFDTVGILCQDPALLARTADKLLPLQEDRDFSEVRVLEPEGVNFTARMIQPQLEDLGLNVTSTSLTHDQMDMASEAFRILQGRDIWRQLGQWVEETNPAIAEDILKRLKWCSTLTDDDEKKALETRSKVIEMLTELSADGKYLVCLPSTPGASPLLDMEAEALAAYRNRLMGMTALAGLWGAPVVALPWLEQEGAPWGISLMASPGHDRALLSLITH